MADDNITIAAKTIGWYGPSSGVELWVYSTKPWVTAAGTPVNASSPYDARTLTQPYKKLACTVNAVAHTCAIEAKALSSTEDAQVNPDVTLIAVFMDTSYDLPRVINGYSVFGGEPGATPFRVPNDPTSTTWVDLALNMSSPSGPLTPADRTVNDLTVLGDGDVAGDMHVTGGLRADGPISSDDTLEVNDDVNVTGVVTAASFAGNGSLLTGVLPVGGSGGASSTGSHTFLADSDNNDPAAIADTQVGVTTVTRAHRDYFRVFKPLRLAGYATGSLPAGVETELAYDTDRNSPVFHDGAGWKTFSPSPVTVYASSAAAQDSDLETGGGTDDTAALQDLLDVAQSLGRVRLVLDGVSLVSGLDCHSDTEIVCLPGCGLYLDDNSDRAVLRNANRVAGPGTIVDRNITVRGLTVNGNRDNQADDEGDDTFVVGLQFFGVENVTLENVTVNSARKFALHFANARNVWLRGTTVTQPDRVLNNHDGIHLNGYCENFWIDDTLLVQTSDDGIALNATDDPVLGPYVVDGPIKNVQINGLTLDGCYFGVRLFTGDDRIDAVFIRGVTGTIQEYVLRITNVGNTTYSTGNVGRVTLEGVHLTSFVDVNQATYNEAVRVECRVESLTVRDFRQGPDWYANYLPIIRFLDGADVLQCDLDLTVYDPAGTTIPGSGTVRGSRVKLEGESSVARLRVRVDHYREGTVTQALGAVHVDCASNVYGVGELQLSGTVNRQFNTIALTGGKIDVVRLDGLTDLANGGSTLYVQDGGAGISAPVLFAANVYTGGGGLISGAGASGVIQENVSVDGDNRFFGLYFSLTGAMLVTGATPSVSGTSAVKTNNGSATTITNFTGGGASQVLLVIMGEGNSSIQNNANIVTGTGADIAAGVGKMYLFFKDGSVWRRVVS